MKHLYVILLFLTVLLFGFTTYRVFTKDVMFISATKAAALSQSGDMIIVDIRSYTNCAKTGKAKSSYHLPQLKDETLDEFFKRISSATSKKKFKQIGIMCNTGMSAAEMAASYHDLGKTNVVAIIGGMEGISGWLDGDFPTEDCPL